MTILFILFQKIEKILPNSFYEASITVTKIRQRYYKIKNYKLIHFLYIDAKILNKIWANQTNNILKG